MGLNKMSKKFLSFFFLLLFSTCSLDKFFVRKTYPNFRSRASIQQEFKQKITILKKEYERSLKKDPSLQGKLLVKFIILPNGKVSSLRVITSTLNNPAFEKKVIKIIKRIRFSPLSTDDTVEVTYPLYFFPKEVKKSLK
jgi:TonB family protein